MVQKPGDLRVLIYEIESQGTQRKRETREEDPFWSCVYGEGEKSKVGAEEMDTKG